MIAGQIIGNELAGPAAGGWLFGMTAVTMRQRQVPDDLLGRVTGIYSLSRVARRLWAPSAAVCSPPLSASGPR